MKPIFHSILIVVVLVVGAISTDAQTSTVRADQEFQGRKAWVIENGTLHVTVLSGGGHTPMLADAARPTNWFRMYNSD